MQKLSIQTKFEVLNIALEKIRWLNSGTVSNCAATRRQAKIIVRDTSAIQLNNLRNVSLQAIRLN